MSEIRKDQAAKKAGSADQAAKSKRPYSKPDFQHEKVFETMALACGKISPTQAQCRFNRRNS
jgi:hypothetical protein